MGCAVSLEEKEENAINDGIDKQIKEDGKKLRDEVKMLLLGMCVILICWLFIFYI